MKKLLFILFLFQLSVVIAQGQWQKISCGLYNNTFVNAIAKHNASIFAACWAFPGRVYRSDNFGVHWDTTSSSIQYAQSLYSFNSKLFVGGENPADVFYSTNNGVDWIRTNFNKLVNCFTNNGAILFAGCNSYGVWYSTNSGINWNVTSLSSYKISSLAVNNYIIYASSDSVNMFNKGGIFFSTNNGTSWNSIFGYSTNSLTATGNFIFAGCGNNRGVFYTSNNGQNWNQTSLNNETIMSLCSDSALICAGTSNGKIFISTDYGQNWTQTFIVGNINIGTRILSLMKDGNYIYAGVEDLGIYLSSNNGLSWTTYLNENDFVESIYKYDNLYYTGISCGAYISSNNGSTFFQTLSTNTTISDFSGASNNIYCSSRDPDSGYVFVSTNYGFNWQKMSTINYPLASILIDNPYQYIGCMYSGGLWRSTNFGLNWSQTSLGSYYIYGIEKIANKIIAGTTGHGIMISTNNGYNWYQSSLNNITIWSLSTNGTILFAGTTQGVYYSTNLGENWIQSSLNTNNIYAIHASGPYVLIGNIYGTGFSQDFGNTWIDCSQNISGKYVRTVFISNDYVYAGTYGEGLWRRPLSELVGIQNISTEIPSGFSLSQNYPNPFNPVTKIKFELPSGFPLGAYGNDKVVLKVFDITGREIATLVNESLKPGTYEVTFNGSNYASGVYFYQMRSGDFTAAKKLILLK
jgi:photosystem II stability/assembly factor-like uncharacterized protein